MYIYIHSYMYSYIREAAGDCAASRMVRRRLRFLGRYRCVCVREREQESFSNPSAETALQPLMLSFESLSAQASFFFGGVLFHTHTHKHTGNTYGASSEAEGERESTRGGLPGQSGDARAGSVSRAPERRPRGPNRHSLADARIDISPATARSLEHDMTLQRSHPRSSTEAVSKAAVQRLSTEVASKMEHANSKQGHAVRYGR